LDVLSWRGVGIGLEMVEFALELVADAVQKVRRFMQKV
jgi:hypothetical protein